MKEDEQMKIEIDTDKMLAEANAVGTKYAELSIAEKGIERNHDNAILDRDRLDADLFRAKDDPWSRALVLAKSLEGFIGIKKVDSEWTELFLIITENANADQVERLTVELVSINAKIPLLYKDCEVARKKTSDTKDAWDKLKAEYDQMVLDEQKPAPETS